MFVPTPTAAPLEMITLWFVVIKTENQNIAVNRLCSFVKKLKMKRLLFLITYLGFAAFLNAQEYTQAISEIRETIGAHEKAVHIFHDWQRDPFITSAPDGDYYLTMTQHGETIDGRPCISWAAPLYKSKDLAEWKFAGYYYNNRGLANQCRANGMAFNE